MIKKDKPNPYINTSGTLSVSSAITGSMDVFNKEIETLKSVVQANPSLAEYITPAIIKLNETKDFIHDINSQLLDSKKSELDNYKETIKDYEGLINKPEIEESELQDFFETNTLAKDLFFRGVKEFFPRKSLGGERIPDFIAILHTGEHVLIEIEEPTDILFKEDGDPTVDFTQAEQQIQNYLTWVDEDKDFLRKRGLPNISVENTKGLLVIGMKSKLKPEEITKMNRKNYGRNDYTIKTFDEILLENKEYLKSITKEP